MEWKGMGCFDVDTAQTGSSLSAYKFRLISMVNFWLKKSENIILYSFLQKSHSSDSLSFSSR